MIPLSADPGLVKEDNPAWLIPELLDHCTNRGPYHLVKEAELQFKFGIKHEGNRVLTLTIGHTLFSILSHTYFQNWRSTSHQSMDIWIMEDNRRHSMDHTSLSWLFHLDHKFYVTHIGDFVVLQTTRKTCSKMEILNYIILSVTKTQAFIYIVITVIGQSPWLRWYRQTKSTAPLS